MNPHRTIPRSRLQPTSQGKREASASARPPAITIATAALLATLATLPLPPPVASARPAAQATPTPHSTASAAIIGALPVCDGVLSPAPNAVRLTVGETFTVTTRVRIRCPRLLEGRGAVIVVGTVPAGAAGTGGASLARIVDALADTGTSRVAVIDVAAPDTPVTWAVTPDALAATAARLRAIAAGGVPGSSQWLTALDAADAALHTLPPTQRPLLVVLDGASEAENPAAVIARLVAVVGRNHDATGHSVLIGLSPDGWLGAVPSQDTVPRSTVVLVQATVRSGVERVLLAVRQVVAAFQAPMSRVQLLYASFGDDLAVVSADPPAADTRNLVPGFQLEWWLAPEGFTAEAVVSATLRAVGPTLGEVMVVGANIERFDAARQSSIMAPVTVCVDPAAPQPPHCDGSAASTPTPAVRPPPSQPAPPSPTPRRPAPSPDRAALYLPLAHRLR